MHGDKSQGQRERALARFERGDVEVLVATDVAARGIDVADIAHVVNFDVPDGRDSYVHRVGRTGRAGRTGAGTSFVLTDQAAEMRRIARDLGLTQEFEQSLGHVAPEKQKQPQGQRPSGGQGQRRRRRRRKVAA
jgi:superfamily II DNA/RNA helicase